MPHSVYGQDQEKKTEPDLIADLAPTSLGQKWRAINPPAILKSDQWSVLPSAEVYREYGLQNLVSRIYSDGITKATVEVFDLRFTSGAYGLYTFNRGTLSANRREFFSGHYLVSIAFDRSRPIDQSLFDELKKIFSKEPNELPVLPSHLPEQNKIAESEIYIVGPAALAQLSGFDNLKDIIYFDGGVEVVSARYKNGGGQMSLMIVEYHTPQSAADGLTRATQFLASLDQTEKEKRILRRRGNYIIHAINVTDSAETEKIVSQIKYNPKVYWEGRKLSDVPLEFRPPDPAAIAEATKTIKVIIRSFYGVGMMLILSLVLGLIAGCSYFYWRRYRRRKLGIDDLFSDAGETVRLNLDDYLLKPEERSVKQIGEGK